ncbi:Rv3235 family protein [Streptomyces sp. NBRC 110028]|uniref:Rv3235 family protein n=1 Tax=Streptomyces sp. NBRC 110028 TaxID=1621260 RepID=UPI000ABEE182|nr:Rv3235 family protein [Streptomyces sp. NBRC 110028]
MHEITRTATRTDRGATGTAARRRSGGPPGRRDSRRPGGATVRRPDGAPGGAAASHPGTRTATRRTAAVSRTAALAAVQRERDRLPHYWFAHRLLLTLSGQRPVHILLGHALPDAYDQLIALAPRAPLRPAAGRAAPVVRRCGEYRPRHGVIEAFARIASGDRLSALAFRLELGADARWRCAAVDLGPLVT